MQAPAKRGTAVPAPSLDRKPVQLGGEVFIPIEIGSMRLDSTPPFDLYFRPGPDQPFVLYCQRNTPFTEAALQRLVLNRVEQLFIKEDHKGAYNLYLAEHLETILNDPKLKVKEKALILYDSAQAVVEDVLNRPISAESVGRGKAVVRHTVDFMKAEDFKLEHLLRTISCDYYLYTHCVNVVAYSVALAMRAGYADRATLREIANGALLHDFGKSQLDPQLVNKSSSLSAEEWDRIKKHPHEAVELLRAIGGLGEIALDIVLHHHEKMNGTGYPDQLRGEDISPFVRIVTIADIFDALTTERFHQKARSTFEALSIMQKNMKEELDPQLVRVLIEMMGKP